MGQCVWRSLGVPRQLMQGYSYIQSHAHLHREGFVLGHDSTKHKLKSRAEVRGNVGTLSGDTVSGGHSLNHWSWWSWKHSFFLQYLYEFLEPFGMRFHTYSYLRLQPHYDFSLWAAIARGHNLEPIDEAYGDVVRSLLNTLTLQVCVVGLQDTLGWREAADQQGEQQRCRGEPHSAC